MSETYAPAGASDVTGRVEIIGPPDTSTPAEVRPRTDGIVAVQVADDCTSFQAVHIPALTPEDDMTVTFDQRVRLVRVVNWTTNQRLLVKDGPIADSADDTATRVGYAPTTSVPATRVFPFVTDTIHVLSAGANEVTVEGFF